MSCFLKLETLQSIDIMFENFQYVGNFDDESFLKIKFNVRFKLTSNISEETITYHENGTYDLQNRTNITEYASFTIFKDKLCELRKEMVSNTYKDWTNSKKTGYIIKKT